MRDDEPQIYKRLTRSDLIRLLEDNDSNGCYSDHDCLLEFGYTLSNDTLIELAIDQDLID